MCMWFWGYPPIIFINFFFFFFFFFFSFLYFFDLVFQDLITINLDLMWAQHLLDFSTDHLETMHTCSTWYEDVRVVLG